jgi:hypothetical protein
MEAGMPVGRKHERSKGLRGVRWGLCVYLLDGPLTMEQLKDRYGSLPFPFPQQPGFYASGQWNRRGLERLPEDLAGLLRAGWVSQEGDQFALTERGREQVGGLIGSASSSSERVIRELRALFQPELASKVTLAVQIVLAAIKLPAGLLSGSVGLLNDSADTILDLFSGFLVYLGVRFNKQRIVSILLVVFMLGTGGFTLYEAVRRLWAPYVPQVDWFPFTAALFSALAGLLLWTYQRYVGIQSGLMAFITESVDSRNHVIVALAVTAGLAAALLRFGLLDLLVGLIVAILILWSAIQLAVDLARSSADGRVDVTHYGFWLLNVYENLRDAHLREWMLFLVEHEEIQTKDELVSRAHQAFDFRNNPWMRLVGLDREFESDANVQQNLEELFSRGWLLDQHPLAITLEGKQHLARQDRRQRGRAVQTRLSH